MPIMHKLGTFEVASGKMIVSDPCYTVSSDNIAKNICDLSAVIEVDNGVWHAYVYESNWAKVCKIVIHHNNIQLNDVYFSEVAIAQIGVDSGQAGFFDSKHYRDDLIVGNSKVMKFGMSNDGDKWYNMCCYATLKSKTAGGGVLYGSLSQSGHGDGCYNVYPGYHKSDADDTKLLALQILFARDEPSSDSDSDW